MRSVKRPIYTAAVAAAIAMVNISTAQAQTAPACSGGVVALRFDDGPVAETNQILDLLKANGLRATFFVIGEQVQAYPEITKRIVREGHAIANHTWSHPALAEMAPAQVAQELKSTNDLVYKLTGVRPKFAGPPYGSTSDMVRAEMAKLGMREVLKSRDSEDWDGAEDWQVMNNLMLVPPGGIILMHDWSPVIPQVIPQIKWYWNTYWAKAPICSGRVAVTTQVNPVLDWLGQYYFAHAVKWQ
jgi:peptidoglycan-N-acetylglucosamine deacetylase